jgi:transcriptional regulator GlxA family with amidase domain
MAMIGVLIFPGFQLLDAAGPISVFEIAGRYTQSAPTIRLMAVNAGPVRSSSGVEMLAYNLRSAEAMTTLIVAGGEGVTAAMACKTTIAFVRRLARRGVRVASVCSGAYVLAEAGLLDGRRATTHWCRTQDFVSRYPKVRLEPDQIFTQDGGIWTSAGITAGIDLALAMVAADHGEMVAQDTARQLVLYHRRNGAQSQFSYLLQSGAPSGRFSALLSWMRERLDKSFTVDSLAEHAGMSPRHFARAFTAEMGTTPAKAVERLRIEVARERVQSSSDAIEQVAAATGFRDPERMRRAFIRAFGRPPQSLRRAARSLKQAQVPDDLYPQRRTPPHSTSISNGKPNTRARAANAAALPGLRPVSISAR